MPNRKLHLSHFFSLLAAFLVLSSAACSLPSLSFREPVWVIDLPVTFTGRFNVVEHHTSAGQNLTCSEETTGTLTVDSQGRATFTTQGGVFSIDADGHCLEQGKEQGWQSQGQVENPSQPYLKFTTCSTAEAAGYRAEGSAEHVVAEYHADTQTGKLTGGVTCFDEHDRPISEFAFYLSATEPRK